MDLQFEREYLDDFSISDYWLSVTARDLGLRKARWAEEDASGEKNPAPIGLEPQEPDYLGGILRIGSTATTDCIDAERVQGIVRSGDTIHAALHDSVIKLPSDITKVEVLASTSLFNDLHSIRVSSKGFLLTSTGIDSILEMNSQGDINWRWHATEHGYNLDSFGNHRELDLDADHRPFMYDTWINTTHLNSAIEIDEATVLASLFHQGTIIAIDKETGEHSEIVTGLVRPHALRTDKLPEDTFSFANTAKGEIVTCLWDGENANLERKIRLKTGWLQDCIRTEIGWLAVDGENAKVLHLNDEGAIKVVDHFNEDYLLYDVAT